jgi:hypothetical protein
MTKPVRDRSQQPRESSKAWAAFVAYRDTPPGARSLEKLAAQFREQKRRHQSDPEGTPPPPTTNPAALRLWSSQFHWQARVAAYDAELDFARRAEQRAQVERQARENAQLMQQVGGGALALAAMTLNDMIDSATGELKRPLEARDLPRLMETGAHLLGLATGQPTSIVSNQADSTQLEHVLRHADEQTRLAVINGLKAALRWQQEHGGG